MKRNKWFKILLVVIALAMLAAVMSACNPTVTTTAPTSGTTAPTTAAPTTTEPMPDYVNAKGVFPIATKELTLTFAVPQDPIVQDYTTNYLTKWLEEKSGCKFEFITIPQSEYVTKVQLSLASFTDLPDAYMGVGRAGQQKGGDIFNATNILRYANEGQIIALDEYIERYGENIFTAFEKYSDGLSLQQMMTSADGKIYFMPNFNSGIVTQSDTKLYLNQGWLTKLNLQVPTTTEEMYNVLKAFKTMDPNGNNKADEIPLIGTNERSMYAPFNYLIGSFIQNNPKNSRLVDDGSGKLIFAPITNEWREAMKYLNRLTTEELMSPLSFTTDINTVKQIVNDANDICGGFVGVGLGHFAQGNNPDVCNRFVGVVPMKGPAGIQTAVCNATVPTGDGVITSECEYPEVVFRIMDLLTGPEASTINRYGEKGVEWVDADAGSLSDYSKPATIKVLINNLNQPQNKGWNMASPFLNVHNDYQQAVGAKPGAFDMVAFNAAISVKYLDFMPEKPVSIIIYPLDAVEKVNEAKRALEDYVLQTIAKFSVGEYDPNNDTAWQNYLKEFDAIGLEEFMTASQSAYDTMNK